MHVSKEKESQMEAMVPFMTLLWKSHSHTSLVEELQRSTQVQGDGT